MQYNLHPECGCFSVEHTPCGRGGRLRAAVLAALAALAAGPIAHATTPDVPSGTLALSESLKDRLVCASADPSSCEPSPGGKFKIQSKIAFAGVDPSQFDETTSFAVAIGNASFGGVLGDDPAFVAGSTAARFLTTHLGDKGKAVKDLDIALKWSAKGLTVKVAGTASPSQDPILAGLHRGRPAGKFADGAAARIRLGGVEADFSVPIAGSAATKAVRKGPQEFALHQVQLKGKAAVVPAVIPPSNRPPAVDAGPDRTVTLPAVAGLDGTVTDDGLPDPPGRVTVEWTMASGPGAVIFGDAFAVDTTAAFSRAGVYVLRLTASDGALSASDAATITVNDAGNSPPAASDDFAATIAGEAVPIAVLANDSDPDGDPLSITGFTQPAGGAVTAGVNALVFTPAGGFTGTAAFTYTIGDGKGGAATASVTVAVVTLPPDPASVAPPPENGAATVLAESTSFLYTGLDAVQFGVAPGTIEPVRAAVIRGAVKAREGGAIAGVRITILGHPEFGATFSRADGLFDLAVNGGGLLTLSYEKTGFCPAQRQLNVPWQDYAVAPEVVLIAMDPAVTPVALGDGAPMQVHRGSPQADADGSRRATLLFTPGTCASLVVPGAAPQDVGSLSVRATEFTVGAGGPEAMPAVLPPTSGYTYAVELSADEAAAGGATMVAFDRPVYSYVENFIGFPVGTPVPAGYYDRERGTWVASDNGLVIEVLSITEGAADLDLDGDGNPDGVEALAALAITDGERRQLAALYAPGDSLWRVPVTHFTPWDYNWPVSPPDDADSPAESGAGAESADDPLEDPSECQGCVVEVENQALGETVPIIGTPYSLNYRSDRVPGRSRGLGIRVSGSSVPLSLASIRVDVSVAGQAHQQSFAPSPGQTMAFVWDGMDAYGRPMQGGQMATVCITYTYPAVFRTPSQFRATVQRAFALFGGAALSGNRSTSTLDLTQKFKAAVGEGILDARAFGLGGWTLSAHHFYDPIARVLHTGDGRRRRAASVARVVDTLVPPRTGGASGQLSTALAVGPDGSVYFSSEQGRPLRTTLRQLTPEGAETVVAGGGDPLRDFKEDPEGRVVPLGDDGPAIGANIGFVQQLAIGPDGSLYLIGTFPVIRRVGPDGILRRVAGRYALKNSEGACQLGPGPDGILATETDLCIGGLHSLEVGPDGSLYILEQNFGRVRRVGPDGIITTVAGTGVRCPREPCGDGGPATASRLRNPIALGIAPDGTLYIADGNVLRRVRPDGIIERIAGSGTSGFAGDGGPAANAVFCSNGSMAFSPDGSIYLVDINNKRIRLISADGIITTVAGEGVFCSSTGVRLTGEGGPALQAQIGAPVQLALAPDGTLLYSTFQDGAQIRRVGSPLSGFTAADIVIASEDASELYVFDQTGRHLRTLHALTGAVLYEFGYDAGGRLGRVVEKTGGTDNVTSIERDGEGKPTAIVGPFGQTTLLAVDGNGFLAGIANPAGEQTKFCSTADGLLTAKTDPRGNRQTFTYDAAGRLVRDLDPAGGSQDLARTDLPEGFAVARTTALDRVTTHEVENLPGNIQRRTITAPDRTASRIEDSIDAGTTRVAFADGSTAETVFGPDPRFGMEAPNAARYTLRHPSQLTFSASSALTAALSNPLDPLSLTELIEALTVDGRTSTIAYDVASRTYTGRSPGGRTRMLTLDALGRPSTFQIPGLEPSAMTYDNRGRLAEFSIGAGENARSMTFSYNAQGFLESAASHAGDTVGWTYDGASRIVSKTLRDGRVVRFGFDAAGNLTSVLPPGRTAHTFEYSPRDELITIAPPDVPGTGPTKIAYNADGQITSISEPDGRRIEIGYDGGGRPVARTIFAGGDVKVKYSANYHPDTGRIQTIAGPGAQTIQYTHDGAHIIGVIWDGPVSGAVARAYDSGFRLATESVNGVSEVAYTYDADDLLIGAGGFTIRRHPDHGLPVSASLGVVTETLSHNGFADLTGQSVTANGSELYRATYIVDAIGRVSRKIETIEGVAITFDYSYDAAGRLRTVSRDGVPVENYAYDANGNRTSADVNGVSVSAAYDAQDRLVQYGSARYVFNASGQLQSRTDGSQTTVYDYDALGNLLSVTLHDGTAIAYILDGLDRRIGKMRNGSAVQRLLYAGDVPIAEVDGQGTVASRFIHAGGDLAPQVIIKNGVAHRVITDQVGSVRLVINGENGEVVQRLDYDGFGNVILDTNPGFQPFGFAGGLYDPDTGLVRFGARDFDPITGRWTAKDPLLFAGLDSNLYAYALNDPINRNDPGGTGVVGDVLAAVFDSLLLTPLLEAQFLFLGPGYASAIVQTLLPHLGIDPMSLLSELLGLGVDTNSTAYVAAKLCVGIGQLAAGGVGAIKSARAAAEAAEAARLAKLSKANKELRAANDGKQVFNSKLSEQARMAKLAAEEAQKAQRAKRAAGEALQNMEYIGWEGGGGGGRGSGRY